MPQPKIKMKEETAEFSVARGYVKMMSRNKKCAWLCCRNRGKNKSTSLYGIWVSECVCYEWKSSGIWKERTILKHREREREKKKETRKEIRWLFHNSYFIRFRYPVAAYVRRRTNTSNTHTTAHSDHVYGSAVAALQTIHHRTNTQWTHFPCAHTHAHFQHASSAASYYTLLPPCH